MSDAVSRARTETLANAELVDLEEGSEAHEFLLLERPRLVSATLYLALFMLAAVLVWSFVGKIQVTVTAPGSVRPEGDVVAVQSPVTGLVTEVVASEGAIVATDAVLLRFDPRPVRQERAVVAARLDAKQRERLDALENRKLLARSWEADRATYEAREKFAADQVGLAKKQCENTVEIATARLEVARASVRDVRTQITEQEKAVKVLKGRVAGDVKTAEELEREESKLVVLRSNLETAVANEKKADRECVPDETEIERAKGRLEETKALLAKEKAAYEIKDGEAAARVTQMEGEGKTLEKELEVIDLKLQRVELRAPVGGLVSRLEVLHPGRVLPEGATAAEVCPSGHELVLEAYVRNTDRGDLKVGLPAIVRFAAFPYQEYGALDGEITDIAPDAMKPPAGVPGVPKDGLVYRVIILLRKRELVNNFGRVGRVELGMTAEVDIVVEEVPLIVLVVDSLRTFLDYRKQPR